MKRFLLLLLLACSCGPCCPCGDDCSCDAAEPAAICFTDPVNCPPCKVLDRSWVQAKPAIQRIVIDVRTVEHAELSKWSVACWPTTFLVEMDGERCTKVYRRREGAMTPAQLLEFLKVPE